MRYAQNYYLRTNQRDFALEFKKLADFLREEVDMIHRIQVCSFTLSQIDRGNTNRERSEVLQELITLKKKYERTYGPYELDHYQTEEIPSQDPVVRTDHNNQLSMF